jgi:hypothetical protein
MTNRQWKSVFVVVMTLWVIVMAVTVLSGCSDGVGANYSSGFRVGFVQKASQKGIVWKSVEGELVLASFRSSTKSTNGAVVNSMTNVWRFSVRDAGVAEQIDEAAATGHLVKLSYRQSLFMPSWVQDTPYTIVKVEVLDQTSTPMPSTPMGR